MNKNNEQIITIMDVIKLNTSRPLFLEKAIINDFMVALSYIQNYDLEDLLNNESFIVSYITNYNKSEKKVISNTIFSKFIRQICLDFYKGNINNSIITYTKLLNYLTEEFNIREDKVLDFERIISNNMAYTEPVYTSPLAESAVELLNIKENKLEVAIIREFMSSLAANYPENIEQIIDVENAIVNKITEIKNDSLANIESETPINFGDSYTLGYIRPICTKFLEKDYKYAEQLYFALIDFLCNYLNVDYKNETVASQQYYRKKKTR